jgi:hypothetical protein
MLISGQKDGDAQFSKMGTYKLVPGRLVQSRPVYQHHIPSREGEFVPSNCYLYQAATGQWVLGTAKTLEAGVGCYCFAQGDPITPDKVTGTWFSCPEGISVNASEFVRSPKFSVKRAPTGSAHLTLTPCCIVM